MVDIDIVCTSCTITVIDPGCIRVNGFLSRPIGSTKATASASCSGWKAQRKENYWGREPALGSLPYTSYKHSITSPFPTVWNWL